MREPNMHYGTGRRKSASARVFLRPGKGNFQINGRPLRKYFTREADHKIACRPLELTNTAKQFDITVTVRGGGDSGQLGAVSHGLARALVACDRETYYSPLRQAGLMTRDARTVERKKVGLHKARKASQYSKR